MIGLLRYFVVDAWALFGWRVPALVVLMILSGLLEGLAVTAALPLLNALGAPAASTQSGLVAVIGRLPDQMGFPEGPIGIGMLMVILIFASTLAFLAQARLAPLLRVRYVKRWQTSVFETALAAGPRFLDERRGGDVVAALVSDTVRVSGALYHICLVTAALANLIVYLVLALLISPSITMAIVTLGAIVVIATRPFLVMAYQYGQGITRAQSDMQALATQYVMHSKIVKASAAEEPAVSSFAGVAGELAHLNFRSEFDLQKAKAMFEFAGAVGVAALLIAGPLVLAIDIATVLIVLALFVRLLPRMTAVQQGFQALSALLPALGHLRMLLDEARAVAEPSDPRPLPDAITRAAPEIALSNVTVRRGDRVVLQNLDLVLPAGKTIAFVGPSGSGKSTLVDAILGLVPVEGGAITIAEHDLQGLPKRAWRRSIGYVGQTVVLFSGSIGDNIRFGTDADARTVERALTDAAAHFVNNLPAGVETQVGDLGSRLSGGERQRLALARAFAAPRCVYILDEATSALDAETEAEVVRNLETFAGDATIVIIAHRFSAVRNADVIHVVEDGRVVESGTWNDLDQPGHRFWQLKQHQAFAPQAAGV